MLRNFRALIKFYRKIVGKEYLTLLSVQTVIFYSFLGGSDIKVYR